MLAFLNSGLGLLLLGAVLGAIGLFTWQRQDWIFKQAFLRAEVMLDRRLNLIETINPTFPKDKLIKIGAKVVRHGR